jgi:gamma-glutamyl-gamma-aminobutyrate hydrolase PuuD
MLGVQWHPEMMHRADTLQMKPFEALIVAASTAQLAAV